MSIQDLKIYQSKSETQSPRQQPTAPTSQSSRNPEDGLLEAQDRDQDQDQDQDQDANPPNNPQPVANYHLLIVPPAASPILETSADKQYLVDFLLDKLELALMLGEESLWQVYLIKGELLTLVGDLSRGVVAIREGDEITKPSFNVGELEKLAVGQVVQPLPLPDKKSESSLAQEDFTDDGFEAGDLFG